VASRRKARILAFQALYAWDVSGESLDHLMELRWLDEGKRENLDEEISTFTRLIIAGTIENIQTIDTAIKDHLERWSFERLKRVDLAILRIGTYSLLFQKDIPAGISIDEAIEIAKEFGSDESYKFVNGVLDGIHKASPKRLSENDTSTILLKREGSVNDQN
jgi:N utilization substance protein B